MSKEYQINRVKFAMECARLPLTDKDIQMLSDICDGKSTAKEEKEKIINRYDKMKNIKTFNEVDIIMDCPDDYGYPCVAYCDDITESWSSDLCAECWKKSKELSKE